MTNEWTVRLNRFIFRRSSLLIFDRMLSSLLSPDLYRGMRKYPANISDHEIHRVFACPSSFACVCSRMDIISCVAEAGSRLRFLMPRRRIRALLCWQARCQLLSTASACGFRRCCLCEPAKVRHRARLSKRAGPGQLPHRLGTCSSWPRQLPRCDCLSGIVYVDATFLGDKRLAASVDA